jgi:hypothetical protein
MVSLQAAVEAACVREQQQQAREVLQAALTDTIFFFL